MSFFCTLDLNWFYPFNALNCELVKLIEQLKRIKGKKRIELKLKEISKRKKTLGKREEIQILITLSLTLITKTSPSLDLGSGAKNMMLQIWKSDKANYNFLCQLLENNLEIKNNKLLI